MFVMVVGLNHRTAPIEMREKLTFSSEEMEEALHKLKKTKSVLEAVIVSTCNRTEIYAVVDQLHTGHHFVKRFMSDWFMIAKETLYPYLYIKEDVEATDHLFHVIVGLDSMIIGETQILGQIRQSFLQAQALQATGTIFNTLFKQAITFAKKVHANTGIGENAVSVSYAAVELAKKIFDRLDNKKVLIIGAGETSELTAIHLHAQGVNHIMVANRTFETAQKLAASFHGKPFTLENLADALVEADIVISSTKSNEMIIDLSFMKDILSKRGNKTLFFIDIAVPRDIDPSINALENVYLYDIDDLQDIVQANLEERRNISTSVQEWIDEEVYSFYQWVNTLGVIPLIGALREKSFKIQEETMKSILNKLPDLNEKEVKVIRKHTKSIVNQMLKNPIMRVKEMAAEPDAKEMMEYFKKIFAIEDDEVKSNPVYEGLKNKENKDVNTIRMKHISSISR